MEAMSFLSETHNGSRGLRRRSRSNAGPLPSLTVVDEERLWRPLVIAERRFVAIG